MNVKNIVLGVGIFVVYLMMLTYGIQAFYPAPKYEEYCSNEAFYPKFAEPLGECTRSLSLLRLEQKCYQNQGSPIYAYNQSGCPDTVNSCNFCQKEYNYANLNYEKNIFVIAIIIGIITIFIGYAILSVEPVGSSLLASGIGSIFYGSARNWVNLSNIWRFLLLLLALILLIWIALHINKPKRKWEFWKL